MTPVLNHEMLVVYRLREHWDVFIRQLAKRMGRGGWRKNCATIETNTDTKSIKTDDVTNVELTTNQLKSTTEETSAANQFKPTSEETRFEKPVMENPDQHIMMEEY